MVVRANCVVAVSVAASRLLPGAPVVSISTYVEFCTCGMGVALFEGEPAVDAVPEGVPLGVGEGLREGVTDEVLDEEEPPEGVPDPVLLPLAAAPVGDPLAVREPDGVPLPLGVPEGVPLAEEPEDPDPLLLRVPEGVPLGVPVSVPLDVTDEVLVKEEPPEGVLDPVLLPLGAAPVGEPLTVRVPLGVLELVRVPDGVADGV